MTEEDLYQAMAADAKTISRRHSIAYAAPISKKSLERKQLPAVASPRLGALTFHDGKTVRFTKRGLDLVRRLRRDGMARPALADWFGLPHTMFSAGSRHPDLREVLKDE